MTFNFIEWSEKNVNFILSSEIKAYLKQTKTVSITSEMTIMISYQFTSDWYDLYFHLSENGKIQDEMLLEHSICRGHVNNNIPVGMHHFVPATSLTILTLL